MFMKKTNVWGYVIALMWNQDTQKLAVQVEPFRLESRLWFFVNLSATVAD